MPGISDPGTLVVAAAVEAGAVVVPVPGPCAFVAALAASGLSTDACHFAGFVPPKQATRRAELERLAGALTCGRCVSHLHLSCCCAVCASHLAFMY